MNSKLWAFTAVLGLSYPLWVRAVETLPDPTVANEQLQATLRSSALTKTAQHSDEIKDPTAMNENFRSALTRLNTAKPITGEIANSPVAAVQSFPDIKLLAAACTHHPEKNHAMLSINGKSEMVGMGDKITTVVNNRVTAIEVLDIQKNQVRLRLQPNNEILILR